ncbi:MAG: hypothetical protein ACE5FT_01705 [Candidatus Nanoarchaeia archaeon]
MDRSILPLLLVALISVVGLAQVMGSGATGAALRVIDVREFHSFGERLCPNPARPVPVFETRADLPGTTGKQVLVACAAEGTVIQAHGSTFYPEFNRKHSRFSYGHERFNQL